MKVGCEDERWKQIVMVRGTYSGSVLFRNKAVLKRKGDSLEHEHRDGLEDLNSGGEVDHLVSKIPGFDRILEGLGLHADRDSTFRHRDEAVDIVVQQSVQGTAVSQF